MDTKIDCIADANIFIDFNYGILIKVLCQINNLATTDFITNKMQKPSADDLISLGVKILSLDGDQMIRLTKLSSMYTRPSSDDISALVLAEQLGLTLLTGDNNLRKASKALGVEVHGTLWLLDEMVKRKSITEKKAFDSLSLMVENKRRLPEAQVQKRLKAWKS